MTIVIDTEIIELFRIQWWHLQCKFGIKVFELYKMCLTFQNLFNEHVLSGFIKAMFYI